jgi:hypothetical protein
MILSGTFTFEGPRRVWEILGIRCLARRCWTKTLTKVDEDKHQVS